MRNYTIERFSNMTKLCSHEELQQGGTQTQIYKILKTTQKQDFQLHTHFCWRNATHGEHCLKSGPKPLALNNWILFWKRLECPSMEKLQDLHETFYKTAKNKGL